MGLDASQADAYVPVALRLRPNGCSPTPTRPSRDWQRTACGASPSSRPGFSADCLETLEEIAQENAEIFTHNGGEQFAAIPCLNDSDAGMEVIRKLVLRELQGWI